MSQVGQRWLQTQAQIEEAARACGRDPAQVRLVAVSKRHPAEAVVEAFEAGARDFGENYVQEMVEKRQQVEAALGARAQEIRWHFIGHLQSNKARELGHLALLHTVDRGSLLQKLRARAPQVQGLLLQVNIGDEDSKSGMEPAQVLPFLEQHLEAPGAPIRGLMCIPPPRDSAQAQRQDFALLRATLEQARAALGERGEGLTELSMGMSADFPQAIAEGATLVRVGTAIFGERL